MNGTRRTEAPVLFVFFNRPRLALSVFEKIRRARPRRLFLVSDGPRKAIPEEEVVVQNLREAIELRIDWPVEVVRDYSQENLGCGVRVSTAIESVIRSNGRAIILEDDCLPADTFFEYCDVLLDRYEDDERIGSINGTYLLTKRNCPQAYSSTHFPCIWGWATWARAWRGYDLELQGWSDAVIDEIAQSKRISCFRPEAWKQVLSWIQTNPRSTWDVQFWLQCLRRGLLSVFPYRNQISNLGCGTGGTHFTSRRFAKKPLINLDKRWYSPHSAEVDLQYDAYLQTEFYSNTTTWRNVAWKAVAKLSKAMERVPSQSVS